MRTPILALALSGCGGLSVGAVSDLGDGAKPIDTFPTETDTDTDTDADTDTDTDTDADTDPGVLTASQLRPGELVVTEVMQNPLAAGDTEGEWFEVLNAAGADVDLNGLQVYDDGSDAFTVAGAVLVRAGDRVVLGRNGDLASNGGVSVAYVFSGMDLANGDDELVLATPAATEIDRIAWDDGATWPDPEGASMTLDPSAHSASANDLGASWCESASGFGSGDLGTPGAANDPC